MQEYLDSLQIKPGEIRRIHPINCFVLVVQKMDNEWQVVPFSKSAARTEEGDYLLTGHHPAVLQLQHARTIHPLFLRRSFLVGTLNGDELETVLDSLAKVDMDLTDPYVEFGELDIANYRFTARIQTFTGVKVDLPPLEEEYSTESPCWYFDSTALDLMTRLSFQEIKPAAACRARFCYPWFAPAPKDPDSNLLWDIGDLALPHGNYDALFVHTAKHLLLGSGYAQVNEFGANVAFCDWYAEDASDVKHPEDVTIFVCQGAL